MKESGVPMFKEFDFERGYVMQEKDNRVFIKLLFKNIDDWSHTLSQILSTKIDMIPANKTEKKTASDKYKEFKTLYKVRCRLFIWKTFFRTTPISKYTTILKIS